MDLPVDFVKEINSYASPSLEGLIDAIKSTSPSVSIRVNKYKEVLAKEDFNKVKWCSRGFYLPKRMPFTFDPAMHQGLYYVQDASSMIISHIVAQLCEGEEKPLRYLDACAAPGGKTTAVIDALPNGSIVVANEYIYNRATILSENISKWGYPSIVVSRGDTANFKKIKGYFDIIAADVPCSGEGMFRKDEEAVSQWSPSLVAECAKRQREIVDNLWESLSPGGFFIYSTCTYNRTENEEMIHYIIEKYGGKSVEINIQQDWNIVKGIDTDYHCYRFLPHKVDGEGLFIAVIQKTGIKHNEYSKTQKNKSKNKKTLDISKIKDWLIGDFRFIEEDNQITAIPLQWNEDIKMLKSNIDVIYSGVQVALIKGKDYIPTQSLAMSTALNVEAFENVDIEYEDAISYLRREAITLSNASRGYVLLTYKNKPLGFVKNIGNRANNLYPQEWRILSSHIPESAPIIV